MKDRHINRQDLINELRQENVQLETRCNELFLQVNELIAQIEKMKCCENCKHNFNTLEDNGYCHNCNSVTSYWELKE